MVICDLLVKDVILDLLFRKILEKNKCAVLYSRMYRWISIISIQIKYLFFLCLTAQCMQHGR